jgi:hypothetical protein
MSRYELWDQASGNILGDFDTEAEAQALASDFIAATGSADRFVVIPVNSEAEQALAWALHLADPATTDTGAHTPMCEDRAARILAALSASGYTITETEVYAVILQLAREALVLHDEWTERGWLMWPLPREADVRAALSETEEPSRE